MLKFYFSGADGVVAVPETLTSGMIGKRVGFSFSEEWDGLSKVVVFSAGRVSRDVVLSSEELIIPAEVLQVPMRNLYVGVYGVSQDGTLVIPTIRVKGPFIEAGTDPSGDPLLEPTLPIWSQVLSKMGDLSSLNIPNGDTLVSAMNALAEAISALPPVGDLNELTTQSKENAVSAINELAEAISTLPPVGDLNELTTQSKENVVSAINELASRSGGGLTETEKNLMLTLFKKSVYTSDVGETFAQLKALWGGGNEDAHIHSYTAKITADPTCTVPGVRSYTCSCGNGYTEEIPPRGHMFVNGVCSVCGTADPDYKEEVFLVSITATYSGGDVPVGTDLSALTDIVVTAQYSDGNSEQINGYTLSGEIGQGINTILVTYEDKSASFTVNGIAEEAPVIYSITNSLTNVSTSNSAISVEENTSYTANLTPSNGYHFSIVTVMMGGLDVSASVYSNGVITIPQVTGNLVITAVAQANTGELLYNWDLTVGLTDTVSGVTATLGGNAKQDANGLMIYGADGSCHFGEEIFVRGGVLEIDVASADFKNTGTNGFLVMNRTKSGTPNGVGEAGLTYRSTGQWQYYYFGWNEANVILTDPNAIAGKTIRYVSHENHRGYDVYVGDVLLCSVNTGGIDGLHPMRVQIGSSSTSYYDLVVTGVRVYKGDA